MVLMIVLDYISDNEWSQITIALLIKGLNLLNKCQIYFHNK